LQGGKFGHGFFSAGVTKGMGGALLPGGDNLTTAQVAQGTVISAIIGGTASVISGGKFSNGAKTAAMQYLYNQAGKSIGRMAHAQRLRNACKANPSCGKQIGFSASVSHPLATIVATAVGLTTGEPLPTGATAAVLQSSNTTSGQATGGVDYSTGLGAKLIASIDVIDQGANPNMEISLVVGLGVKLYFEDNNYVGLGFAAGAGASWLTRPRVTSVEMNVTPLSTEKKWGGN